MKLITAFFALSACLSAQSNATDAALDGYVQDPSGAFVLDARVVARNLATNVEKATITNAQGYYRFPLLAIGTYEIRVAAAGFREYRQSGVVLNVGRQVRVDVRLQLGEAQETITVTADAGMVDATTSEVAIGEVVNERALRTLPIVSRNIYNFNLLGPGVKGIPSSGFGTTQFTFGGLNRSTWSVDGLDNTQRRFTRQIRLVINTPESLEEMQVVSNGYSAEFGRAAGGLINVITRSGTNDWHGSLFMLWRPNESNARPPLAAAKPDQSWSDYAGTFGGPLVRDRLFFFGQYEYNPLEIPRPVAITAANAQALGLPASDLVPAPFGETFHTAMGKVNFILNEKNSGFLRYSRFTNDSPGNGGGGLTVTGRSLTFTDRMNGGAAQLATVFSPTLLNELRFGINRRYELREQEGNPGPNEAFVNVLGVANIGNNALANNYSIETSTQLIDNVTWTRGIHTLKTGVDYQTTGFDQDRGLGRTFFFNGLSAAAGRPAVTPLDQYLLTVAGTVDPTTGRPYTYTQLSQDLGDPTIQQRFHFLNWFLQDEIRLRKNLAFNFGVRYERIFFPTLDEQAPYPLSRRIHDDETNFAPRVGLSWSPFADGKTTIRAGYGMFYDTPPLSLMLDGALFNGRRIFNYVLPGSDPAAPRFPNLLQSIDPDRALPPNVTAFAPDFQILYAHQANLQISREIVPDLALNLQYSYMSSRFGAHVRDINLGAPVRTLEDGRPVFAGAAGRPDPNFRAINLVESGGNSNYNGLDITLTKRFSRGIQFSTTYSWSKALSDSAQIGSPLMDPTNRARDYGIAEADVRHNWVFQGLLAPTFGSGAARWMNGFELSTMLFFNSGYPINALAGADLNGDLVLNDRPLYRAKNDVSGPDLLQLDLRLARRIVFREIYNLELMAESENILNRFNANCNIGGCTGAVVNRAAAADFGRVVSTRQARVFQFGFRFKF